MISRDFSSVLTGMDTDRQFRTGGGMTQGVDRTKLSARAGRLLDTG